MECLNLVVEKECSSLYLHIHIHTHSKQPGASISTFEECEHFCENM